MKSSIGTSQSIVPVVMRTLTLHERSLALLARLTHFYGPPAAKKWFDWKRKEFGGRTAQQAIAQGDIAQVEEYVARLGPIK